MLVTALLCAVASGCSSSAGPGATSPTTPPPTRERASSTSGPDAAVQHYLDAVNALCDALLPKVIAVTNGGSLDIPRKAFFAQLPAHARLRAEFDRHLAKIPVPPAAKPKAAALAAYIRFANRLDARRLAAAKRGKAAYANEIAAESDAVNDPTITARDAAGFNESCNAR
jgi:hypothetical protein